MMNSDFHLRWQTFALPKAGHAVEEYEDAVAGDPARGRFAIADGASESAFANTWARILVEAFVQTPGAWARWLTGARQRWQDQVARDDLPWYVEAKAEEGAYAALLGVAFAGSRWQVRAVGDCCLFHVRGRRLLRAFPIHRSADFGNRPSLVGARRRQAGAPRARRWRTRGEMQPQDTLLLMTDALAHWCLRQSENGTEPWEELQRLVSDADFACMIQGLRDARELRNDDVTLALIQLEESGR